MKVKQLHLQNYGRFEDLTIDFAPTDSRKGNVTVIVGNNGAGKSQILQALTTGFSWFVAGLRNKSDGFEIEQTLIKNGKNDVNIELKVDFVNNNVNSITNPNSTIWNISNVKDGKNNSFKNNVSQLQKTVDTIRNKLTKNDTFSLPLLMYYDVKRANIVQSNADIFSHGVEQFQGYHACTDGGAIDFSDFLQWFRSEEDIENEMLALTKTNIHKQVKTFSDSLKLMENVLKLSESYEVSQGDLELKNQIIELEKRRNTYKELLNDSQFIKQMSDKQQLKLLRLVTTKNAIEYFTNFKKPRIRRQGTPTMIVEKVGNDGQIEELDVNQLSQGEKSLLALVGDIARRLAILNPSLDDPLQGGGVVMIDEVDLHLHPKWQHDLIDKLVRTFPNVQFILTTHSPHIISDNPDILVYALNDGELTEVPNIYGEDVNTVLTKVFEVDIRDPKVQEEFDGIYKTIDEKSFTEAEDKLARLEQELPTSNLELLRARLRLTQAKLAETEALKLEAEQ